MIAKKMKTLIIPPQTLFVVGILFSRCPSVCACVHVSSCNVFCFFFNILKSHCWNFIKPCKHVHTVKSRLSERRLSETTGLFEVNGQSRLFSLLSIAIKLPIIRISIIRKIQFFEVIRRSRLKKLLLKYTLRFEVQKSRMVIMISLFGRVCFTHLSDLANKVTPD